MSERVNESAVMSYEQTCVKQFPDLVSVQLPEQLCLGDGLMLVSTLGIRGTCLYLALGIQERKDDCWISYGLRGIVLLQSVR